MIFFDNLRKYDLSKLTIGIVLILSNIMNSFSQIPTKFCNSSLDCLETVCCKNDECVDNDECQYDKIQVYAAVGSVGFVFVAASILYMILVIRSSKKNVENIKLKDVTEKVNNAEVSNNNVKQE